MFHKTTINGQPVSHNTYATRLYWAIAVLTSQTKQTQSKTLNWQWAKIKIDALHDLQNLAMFGTMSNSSPFSMFYVYLFILQLIFDLNKSVIR